MSSRFMLSVKLVYVDCRVAALRLRSCFMLTEKLSLLE